ncbi:hypothetical protein [Sphingopyxis flava]|uniref:hypothetical protein n=1 Tax=Sphingopyxis flava TaxID=1507287 RepID=UPI00111694AE|nr:hypothetical protein [Sphingopyxis flava]
MTDAVLLQLGFAAQRQPGPTGAEAPYPISDCVPPFVLISFQRQRLAPGPARKGWPKPGAASRTSR